MKLALDQRRNLAERCLAEGEEECESIFMNKPGDNSNSQKRDSVESSRTDLPKAAPGDLTPDELISRLRSALTRDGDFPASAKIVTELRQLTSDPKTTAGQVTEVILREPSLGTRVLHLVNSTFYRRAKPIMTVSQAVIQIGMRPLAEMCSTLVLLQKFVPAARQGGSFANCLRRTVLTSLLSSSIAPMAAASSGRTSKNDEFGYLAGSFLELGTLLLAFYFPQVYEAAVKRAESKRQPLGQSLKELTGLTPAQLSIEVIDALQLPTFYRDILLETETLTAGNNVRASSAPQSQPVAKAVAASSQISGVLVSSKTKDVLDSTIAEVRTRYSLDGETLNRTLGELPTLFKNHCTSIDLQLPSLPEFVSHYGKEEAAPLEPTAEGATGQDFNGYVNEIRQAVENREPTSSIITSIMETLAWALKFDRVVLMLMNNSKTALIGRLALGNTPGFDPKKFTKPLGSEAEVGAPEARAVKESRPVFQGKSLLDDGWPVAYLPIGFGTRTVGIIYADRTSHAQPNAELSAREQAAVGILAELLDRSLSLHS